MRNMSCTLTVEQVKRRKKNTTRRLGWQDMKPGERFCLIEKGQGLKKGEKVNRMAIVECVSNRSEPLDKIKTEKNGTANEGFPKMTPDEFITFFCSNMRGSRSQTVQRIQFKYIEDLWRAKD